jgi:hypothetical protein
MPSPKDLNELMEKISHHFYDTSVTEAKMKSIMFNVVDFLLNESNIPDAAIDAGMYYIPSHVGDAKVLKAYQEILYACYEHYCEAGVTGPSGPWVHIDANGISLSKSRRPYCSVEIINGGD